MTRDDIIRMALEAGWKRIGRNHETGPEFPILIERLERFAALVAAAEREACAKICEKYQLDFVARDIRKRGEPDASTALQSIQQQ